MPLKWWSRIPEDAYAFQDRCSAAAQAAHAAHCRLLLTCAPAEQQAEQARIFLAALYGIRAERAAHLVLPSGQPDLQTVSAPSNAPSSPLTLDPEPVKSHCISGKEVYQAHPTVPADLQKLNVHLRGCSRLLFLTVLWSGNDCSALRDQWYHWSDLAPYWGLAWTCTYAQQGTDMTQERKRAARQKRRADQIKYARACAVNYARLHPDGKQHAAVHIIDAAAAVWGVR